VASLSYAIWNLKRLFRNVKAKKSCGIDGIPSCIIKDSFPELKNHYLEIFNQILEVGLPEVWRTAIVTPLHKKSDPTEVGNYRPISNLPSLSKIFEKCILARLNQTDLVGSNQHGFRKQHSTTTAMLEIQGHLAEATDKGLFTLIYSVNMSAAFDLLRPDVFHKIMKDSLDPGILWTLMDFLKNRKMIVRIDSKESQTKKLDRGCVQGSVLGPALFSHYCKDLARNIPEAILTSYGLSTKHSRGHLDQLR